MSALQSQPNLITLEEYYNSLLDYGFTMDSCKG